MIARSSLRLRHLIFALAGACSSAAAALSPISVPTYFDAAPRSLARGAAISLAPQDDFDPDKGFGWKQAPSAGFEHPEFSGVRSPVLCDGVAGADFTLALRLKAGRWTLFAYLDDGHLQAHTVALAIDGKKVAHSQRRFGVSAEPEQLPINRIRVARAEFVTDGTVDIRFSQPEGAVRLLALHLLPMDWEENDTTRWFQRQVEDVGRYPFRTSLEILRAQLDQPRRQPNEIASAAYWKAQLDLLGDAEHWHRTGGWDEVSARTRSSMFTRYKVALSQLDPLVEDYGAPASPLRDRALWLRARLLYWLWLEQRQAADETTFAADIALLKKVYPNDPLIGMYAGEKVPAAIDGRIRAPLARAPAWSAAQFEALQRLRDVAHYWIDERQIPNGEFGGKTDDDVELLRWWPTLMFSGDAKAVAGFRRLADGVWFSPRMHLGYSRVARDVEHSSEFVADTVPMMALATLESEWIARLGWSYRHMRDLWAGRNAHGDLHFKSAWIGATEVLSEPPRNRDLGMNARAAKAVRYHAWLTGDREATALLHEWSVAWAKAAASTAKGKPRGLFPASVRWPDAAINGDEPTWYRANMFWDYFDWQGDGKLYDQLLFSWMTTADDRLLEPLRETLGLLERTIDARPAESATPGSAKWAADRLMKSGDFWSVVAQWRLESNDPRFDPFLKQHGPPYLRYRLTGDVTALASILETNLLEVLRFNRPMRTSEVLFTDRVFVAKTRDNASGIELLGAMLTGCHSAQGASPYHHVVWDEAPPAFTALVSSTGRDSVTAELFLHQTETGRIAARFLRLPPGPYRLTVTAASGLILDRIEMIPDRSHRVVFEIPGNTVASVQISPP